MQFSLAALVGVLAAVANAKAVLSNSAFDVVAGKPFVLNWTNATGGVTVELVNGPRDNLKPVLTIASAVTTGTFTWTPPATLPSDTYAFRVTDGTGEPNFSIQFSFQGSGSASVSSSTASSTTARSTTSSGASTTSSSSSSSITSTAVNSTTTTASKTSSTTTSARTTTTAPTNNNSGDRFSSSLALVLVTVAALVCFN